MIAEGVWAVSGGTSGFGVRGPGRAGRRGPGWKERDEAWGQGGPKTKDDRLY